MAPTPDDDLPVELDRNDARREYVARHEGAVVSVLEFMLTPDLVIFTHAESDEEIAGHGVASRLVRFALEDVRARGYLALPLCPFVKEYVGRHAEEYEDLLYRSHG